MLNLVRVLLARARNVGLNLHFFGVGCIDSIVGPDNGSFGYTKFGLLLFDVYRLLSILPGTLVNQYSVRLV